MARNALVYFEEHHSAKVVTRMLPDPTTGKRRKTTVELEPFRTEETQVCELGPDQRSLKVRLADGTELNLTVGDRGGLRIMCSRSPHGGTCQIMVLPRVSNVVEVLSCE